jgi:hypothetical protein
MVLDGRGLNRAEIRGSANRLCGSVAQWTVGKVGARPEKVKVALRSQPAAADVERARPFGELSKLRQPMMEVGN